MGYENPIWFTSRRVSRRQALRLSTAVPGSIAAAALINSACGTGNESPTAQVAHDIPSTPARGGILTETTPQATPFVEKASQFLGAVSQGLEMFPVPRVELKEPFKGVPFHSDKLGSYILKPEDWTLENFRALSDYFSAPNGTNGYKPMAFVSKVENFSGENPQGFAKGLAAQTSSPDIINHKTAPLITPMVGLNGFVNASTYKISNSEARQLTIVLFHPNRDVWNLGLRAEKSDFAQSVAIFEQMALSFRLPNSK